MPILKSSEYKVYSKFLDNLARNLTQYYYSKLDRPFKVLNKKKVKDMTRLQAQIKLSKNLLEKLYQ